MLRVCEAIQALDALPGAPSPRPARNFLEGHRYLTEEEYKEQAASATADTAMLM